MREIDRAPEIDVEILRCQKLAEVRSPRDDSLALLFVPVAAPAVAPDFGAARVAQENDADFFEQLADAGAPMRDGELRPHTIAEGFSASSGARPRQRARTFSERSCASMLPPGKT